MHKDLPPYIFGVRDFMDQKLCPSAGSCNLHGSGLFCRLKSAPVEGGKNTVSVLPPMLVVIAILPCFKINVWKNVKKVR